MSATEMTNVSQAAESAAEILVSDPRVRKVDIDLRDPTRITLHARVDPAWLDAESEVAAAKLAERIQQQWRRVYDKTYTPPAEISPPDFAGWVSSYTGNLIPIDQMERWRDAVCTRMLDLPHEHVLEIGCGIGLILEKVAPHTTTFHGIDLSAAAVARLEGWLSTRPDLAHVTVEAKSAVPGMELPDRPFDLVIFNSVIQYFSSISQLEDLLSDLWGRLSVNGHIFIGDVRPHRLSRVLIDAREVLRSEGAEKAVELLHICDNAAQLQMELTLDPSVFHRLAKRLGASISVRIQHTNDDTEMSRYRYDVVLRKRESFTDTQAEELTFDSFVTRLRAGDSRRAVTRDVHRSGLIRDLEISRLLNQADYNVSVDQLRSYLILPDVPEQSELLLNLAKESGVKINLTLPPDGGGGFCDAWIGPVDEQPRAEVVQLGSDYADPEAMVILRQLSSKLTRMLNEALPDLPELVVFASK